jgi:uncharacterized protein
MWALIPRAPFPFDNIRVIYEKMKKSVSKIIKIVKNQFQLEIRGDHGIFHWEQVQKIGEHLALQYENADVEVICLFAYLHDSKRENEESDPMHGERSAEFVKKLYHQGVLNISQTQYEQLEFSCRHHSDSTKRSDDITVQICWDSDRLDLYRLGEVPDPQYLNTHVAKKKDILKWVTRLVDEYTKVKR